MPFSYEFLWAVSTENAFRAYANSESADQTAQVRSLISAFAVRLQKPWPLCMLNSLNGSVQNNLYLRIVHYVQRHIFA